MAEIQTPEVIIIGAGLGGLCAALELARTGVRVLILERHNLPGGFSTSFVRGRFEFETSLHELSGAAAYSYLKSSGMDIEFLEIPEAYRLLLTEKEIDFRAPFGIENFIKAVNEAVPGIEDSVQQFMDVCRESFQAYEYLGETFPPDLRVLFKDFGNFIRTGAAVTDEVADAVKLPEAARNLIYPYWCYLGVATNRISFPLWASMIFSYLNFGAFIPKGRSHAISVSFAEKIESAGGEIRYNAEVSRLLTENDRVTGVELTSGDRIDCPRIISNISPHRIFGSLIKPTELSRKTLKKANKVVNARKIGLSFFVVFLGLDKDMKSLGLTDYSYFIAPHMDTVRLEESISNRHDPNPMQAAICLNAADKTASPPGTTILSITVGTRPEAWSDVKPEDYHQAKMDFAELVIAQFEAATGTDIRSHIEEIETAAPPTFSRYTASWDGTVYGYQPEPWDSIIPRVLSENREQFVKGLSFCGGNASRTYGFGSSMLSGKAIANKILAEIKSK